MLVSNSSCSVDKAIHALPSSSCSSACEEQEMSCFLSSCINNTPLGFPDPRSPEMIYTTGQPPFLQGMQEKNTLVKGGGMSKCVDWTETSAPDSTYTPIMQLEATSSGCEGNEHISESKHEGNHRSTKYNQSQWTEEEHQRFVLALAKYRQSGNRKDQVAALVGTKSPLQVRPHAQKYFLKLSKMSRGE